MPQHKSHFSLIIHKTAIFVENRVLGLKYCFQLYLLCDIIAHAEAAQAQRKHCCCIVGHVCVAGVVWQWIYMHLRSRLSQKRMQIFKKFSSFYRILKKFPRNQFRENRFSHSPVVAESGVCLTSA
jgi:hypothetical protein